MIDEDAMEVDGMWQWIEMMIATAAVGEDNSPMQCNDGEQPGANQQHVPNHHCIRIYNVPPSKSKQKHHEE